MPLPDLERVPDYERGFWEGTRAGELRIQRCANCGRFRHLPTPDVSRMLVAGVRLDPGERARGSCTPSVIVRHPVHPAIREREQTPYNICMIELEEQDGLRICSNVLRVAPEDITIDMPVQVTFVPAVDNPDVALPVFLPASEQ